MQPDDTLMIRELSAEAKTFLQSVPEEQSKAKYALLLQHVADRTVALYATVDKKRALRKYIRTFSWAPLSDGAAEITGKNFDFEEDARSGMHSLTAYSVASTFFEIKSCGSLFGESGLFDTLAQSNYWHWALVAQAARTAINLKQFPIDGPILVEALKDLQAQVPKHVLELFERRLIAALEKERAAYSLALTEGALYLRPKKGFEESHKSTERLLQESVSRKELAIFVKHGLLLFRHDDEDDLKKATLVFNQTLLFDWQVVRGRTSVAIRKASMQLGR